MSNKLIAGNWKMNLSVADSRKLAKRVEDATTKHADKVEVVVAPSTIALTEVSKELKSGKTKVGVQNIYFVDEGAYTGEVSAVQAQEFVDYAIVGHSERRQLFNESNEDVARKVAACLRSDITPILCVGETGYERDHGETTQVINDQLATCLTMLVASDMEHIVIAYEPIWAIGTGKNADSKAVASAADTIQKTVKEMFGEKASDGVRILYGGSVKADTAKSYLSLDNIDGLLVGGASLSDHEFVAIVEHAADGE